MFSTGILGGQLPSATLAVLGLCLAVTAIGFRKFSYFVGLGYGLSVAASALLCCLLGWAEAGLASRLEAILLAAYGLRLGGFLAVRDSKGSYRASRAAEVDRPESVGLGPKLAMWPAAALLYAVMLTPLSARFAAEASGAADPLPWLSLAGAALTALGLALETSADAQKSAAKKKEPNRFCDRGLYRLTRCPNYFGEILVWTGLLVSGAPLLRTPLAWVLSAAGYASIVFVMIGAAGRLELKQEERYGSDPGFRAYAQRTPVLVPFLPIYSLKGRGSRLG
jgi:steroid 5-alpha reductase family enzyme